ncbi:MAG: chemosensory pili system protein ChpB (putative protein-glutamate methylesterase) [Candidatus Endobugula sp.]|jgi:chemosensory pili system protein ChpB (putative protein-glutamate methylesterase)
MNSLTVGIVSETLVQQHYIKHTVDDLGCPLGGSFLVSELGTDKALAKIASTSINAWIIDVDVERLGDDAEVFQRWLYDLETPIVYSEGNTYNAAGPDFVSWTRQLKTKILSLEGLHQLASMGQIKANNIWVLAASTGGPDAVKIFLDALPSDLDVAFIYVQHLGEGHSQALSQSVVRDNSYACSVAVHGDVLAAGRVLIVPPEHQISLQPNGSVVAHVQKEWRGVYKPSVDHIVANVASNYGSHSGVIFFTGMGSDGSKSCRLMTLHGGQSWTQVLSSCVSTSMPKEVMNTGCSSKMDTPENLARHLTAQLTR